MRIKDSIIKLFKRDATNNAAQAPTTRGETASTPRLGREYLPILGGGNNALCIATVYACIKLFDDVIAALPCQTLKLKSNVFVNDTNSHLHYLLNVQPNNSMSAFDFWSQTVQNMLLDGNAYIVPVYGTDLEINQLILCRRGTVSHDTINDTYTIADTANGIVGTYDENEIIHIKNLSLDGKHGVSVLTFASQTTAIAQTGDRETLNRFSNGGNVRGIVSNDNSIRGFGEYQDDQLAKTAIDIDDKFQSGERIVSLPGQIDFKSISLSSTDMQFLESRKFTVRDICRFFSVPPAFIFDDTSNNYKSAEMANIAFLSNSLNPILRKIENELHRKLVPEALNNKRKFQFDRRSLYACDLDSRVKYQAQTIAAGIYTVNDWRIDENKSPVDGGDTVLVSANLKGIKNLINENKIKSPEEPKGPEEFKNNNTNNAKDDEKK